MKIYETVIGSTVTAIGLSLVICSVASAKERVVVEPRIDSGIQYDSNFWKAEDEETGVNTYFIKPGVTIGYETSKSYFHTDLSVNPYWYDDQDTPPAGTRDSSDDDYVGFTGSLDTATQATDRLKIGLRDNLDYTRDPASADEVSNSVAREKYYINYFTPYLEYKLGKKSSFGAKYTNTYTDYTEDLGGEDSTENRGTFDLNYRLNSKSVSYIEYGIWDRDYDETTSEYLSNRVTLNYYHTFNFLTLVAGAGYHNRSFDDDAYDDIDTFVWNIGLSGEEKVKDNDRKPRYWMDLNLASDFNDAGPGEEYFIATVAGLELGYRFMGNLVTSGLFEFQNSDYQNDPEERDDDTVTTSLRVAYEGWDYITVGLEAGLEDRDSNITGKSYDNNFVLATLDFDYSLGSK